MTKRGTVSTVYRFVAQFAGVSGDTEILEICILSA
jgi:hypothetical protein